MAAAGVGRALVRDMDWREASLAALEAAAYVVALSALYVLLWFVIVE
jgi:hypothetical protein